jgi:hypothetical protein
VPYAGWGNPPLAETHSEAVAIAKRLRHASPKTGERRSFAKISADLAAAGYLNEQGRPFNTKSTGLFCALINIR